jgi:fructose-6-phosphate aldolase 2
MVHLFSTFGLPTRVLAASFKNVQQVHAVAMAGAHAATMSPDLLDKVLAHPLTDSGVAGFNKDWAAAFGSGTTILDLLPAASEPANRQRELAAAEKPQ